MRQRIIAVVLAAAAVTAGAARLTAEERDVPLYPMDGITTGALDASACPFVAGDPDRFASVAAIAGPRAFPAEAPFAARQESACAA